MSDPFDFSTIKPKEKPPEAPNEDLLTRVGEDNGYTSREPTTRVKRRRRIQEPIEVMSIKGPLSVMNRFKNFCNHEGFMSYWTALESLMDAYEDIVEIERKRKK